MKRWKHVFKKGMAFVLSLAMVAGLVLAMSGGANTVQAATGSGTEPSVTAYATKDQLMTAFNPDSNGDATTIGKLVFGKNSSSVAQEWHILGKDEGVSGDNTIIFAASPIATKQAFEDDDSNKKTFASSFGVYETNPSDVYPNHYGASDLRVALKNMATNTSYFTTAEQGLMNPTTVRTNDILNSTTYTTTDKLYALTADGTGSPYTTIKAGSDNNTVLAESSYWRSGECFWLRSPSDYSSDNIAMLAYPGKHVYGSIVRTKFAVQPASNLDLSSVLFASAATAASSDTKSEKITDSAAMTLRLDGTGKDIGTATYNTTTGDIKAVKGATSQTVALVVQGNDGTNNWYYSKKITGTDVVNVSDIVAESNTPASIDLSACKIWLEITEDNVTYVVNATETVVSEISSVAITDIDIPVAFASAFEGEIIRKIDANCGYIHRGIEKMNESLTYPQTLALTDRLDYLGAHQNRHALCMCIEKAMGIEVSERVQYIRTIMDELQRIDSHLLFYSCLAMDLGALTAFFYGFRDREKILDIFEETCGGRLIMNYNTIGGVQADLHPNFVKRVKEFIPYLRGVIHEYHDIFTGNIIAQSRMKGVGILSREDAISFGCTGGTGRASGWACDVRKRMPYGVYDKVDFKEIIYTEGDCFARYLVRMDEIMESLNIIEQLIDNIPEGPYQEKMKPIIRVPEGSYYAAVEGSRGEFGVFLESQGDKMPYRLHYRATGLPLVAAIDTICRGAKIADLIAIGGTLDYVVPDIDR